jgi:serine/threonine-protein kinase
MLRLPEPAQGRPDLFEGRSAPAQPTLPSSNAKAGLRPFSPTQFGRYTLLAPLATGGMAQVFLARVSGVEGFEKLVVIKKILSHLAEDNDFVERFLDEGKIVVKLSHGSIAQVLDMGRQGAEYFIAMEFVDGKDLRKIAARCREAGKPLPLGLSLFIFVRLLDALAYAHRKKDDQDKELNLVHRDVSPQNILISYEGEVKIIDFGLAKSAMSITRTSPSVILGKFFYMSPEQARHTPADRRSDLYAVGICMWELLAGKNPFDEIPPGEILRAVANPQIPRLKTVCPDVPDAVDELVARALAPEPAQRFQSAEEMRGRLTSAMLQADPSAGPEVLASFMREHFSREYDNERKTIAFLSKLPVPEAAASSVDDDQDDGAGDDDREPVSEGESETVSGELKKPASRPTMPDPERAPTFDEAPNTPRSLSPVEEPSTPKPAPSPAVIPGMQPGDYPTRPRGAVFGGAAEPAVPPVQPRRLSRPLMRAAQSESDTDARRETIRFDPLEFVPGEGGDGPPTPRNERAALRAAAASVTAVEFEPERPARRPTSKSRPAVRTPSSPPAPAAAPPPAGPSRSTDPGPNTPPNIVVDKELAASPESEPGDSVMVSPELLAPAKPQAKAPRSSPPAKSPFAPDSTTPKSGVHKFQPATTSTHGFAALTRSKTFTWVLITVGLVCIIAAAVIAIVAFRPSLGEAVPIEEPAPAPKPGKAHPGPTKAPPADEPAAEPAP